MKLQTVLQQLSHGELSQLAIGEMEGDGWPEASKAKLILHINAALTAIHRRFFLKERRERVPLVPDTFQYSLQAKDLIQVEQVLDDAGNEVPLNGIGRADGVTTPDYKTLLLPPRVEANSGSHPLDTTTALTAVYRANFQLDDMAKLYPPNMVEVELPEVYLEPLLFYIASRLQATVGQDGQQITSNNFMMKYEQSCQQLINQGFDISGTDPGESFQRNGWV